MISRPAVVLCSRAAGNLGRTVTKATTRTTTFRLFGSRHHRDTHAPTTNTFGEWIDNSVQVHDCLRHWRRQLLTLGTTWDTFRRRDPRDVVEDLVRAGIPSSAAWDIVRLASKEAERVNAPMAIFWDLESIPISTEVTGQDLVHGLKKALKPYGQWIQFRGYGTPRYDRYYEPDRQSLHLSGCYFVDCCDCGSKDVILVDAMQFAHQNPDNATICLIADDVNYAYLLSVLQQNPNWRTIVISHREKESLLQRNSDITFQWETDILHRASSRSCSTGWNLGRKVKPTRTTTSPLWGLSHQRNTHNGTTTFGEWIHTVDDHDSLRDWRHQLLNLGATWDTFRRRDQEDVVEDLVRAGIPSLTAWDIVRLASKEAERMMAPMAIFWDLENIPIPTGIRGQDVVHSLKKALKPYGQLIQFRGYASIGLNYIPPDKRSDLHLSGCHLVDCPHAGRKDVVDKMILVDAMQFAHQNPDNATICLIAGDVDYAYLLSVLQQNPNWRTIVISRGKQESLLRKNCDITLQWETDILQQIENHEDAEQTKALHQTLIEHCGDEDRQTPPPEVVGIVDTIINEMKPDQTITYRKGDVARRNPKIEPVLTAKNDVEMICHVMKVLQPDDQSSVPRKAVVGYYLSQTFPSRFKGSNTVKDFLKNLIELGIVTVQGEKDNQTLVLTKKASAAINYPEQRDSMSISASKCSLHKIEVLRRVMVLLQAQYGTPTPRKDLVGVTLRQHYSSLFTQPGSQSVKNYLNEVIATGWVKEDGKGCSKILVPLFPLNTPIDETNSGGIEDARIH